MSILPSSLETTVLQRIRDIGWTEPTPIQKKAFPVILRRKNTLLVAPTGSGKTEAAVIPIFTMVSETKGKALGIRVLYITPLRALNRDIFRRIIEYGEKIGLTVDVRHGDTPVRARQRMTEKPPDVLITTPETLAILLTVKRMRPNLSFLEWVVVDELHELLGNERGTHLSISLERVARLSRQPITRVGLSATVGNLDEAQSFLAGTQRRSAVLVDATVRSYDIAVKHVLGGFVNVADYILDYVKKAGSKTVLLFTNTRDEAEHMGAVLKSRYPEVPIDVHHGSLAKEIREEAEERLRKGEAGIVVCTSSLELGLDIGGVDIVIQLGSPRQAVKLVQRVGRSRHRLGETAKGLIVTTRLDDELESLALIKRAREGSLESNPLHEGALDVLSHHLVGLTLEENLVKLDEAVSLMHHAYPFRSVGPEQYDGCLNLLESLRIVRYDGEVVKRRGPPTYQYYFGNISTIPDIQQFTVFDSVAKKPVGRLDQVFVGEYCEPGKLFVLKGSSWRIVSIDDSKQTVFVEPVRGELTAVPYWVGELIPVDFQTAQEVGRLRRLALSNGMDVSETQKEVLQKTKSLLGSLPDEHSLTVERRRGVGELVIHACFGSKVNQTLATLLSTMLSSKTGFLVEARSDPYRILLSSQGSIPKGLIHETLSSIFNIEDVLSVAVVGTHPLNWKTWHVSKKFGLVTKEAQYDRRAARLIQDRYRSTPLYKEVLRELFLEKYDIGKVKRILESIRDGHLRVVEKDVEASTPIAKPILDYASSFAALPLDVEKTILELVRERLENTRHRLLCLACGRWERVIKTKDVPERLACTICHSPLITATYLSDDDLTKIVARKKMGKPLTPEQEEKFRKAWKTASLIQNFGKTAIFILSGYGVGVEVGSRLIRRFVDQDSLLKNIYRAERTYVATRGFWND
ncbi:MAG: DEAD/DEAH box helicase [Thaumarchaeota archaeon]|nr:DEAD/DEAH box helicase [Nitrososphaerota archaeon]